MDSSARLAIRCKHSLCLLPGAKAGVDAAKRSASLKYVIVGRPSPNKPQVKQNLFVSRESRQTLGDSKFDMEWHSKPHCASAKSININVCCLVWNVGLWRVVVLSIYTHDLCEQL